jgi:hypothetical protein
LVVAVAVLEKQELLLVHQRQDQVEVEWQSPGSLRMLPLQQASEFLVQVNILWAAVAAEVRTATELPGEVLGSAVAAQVLLVRQHQ